MPIIFQKLELLAQNGYYFWIRTQNKSIPGTMKTFLFVPQCIIEAFSGMLEWRGQQTDWLEAQPYKGATSCKHFRWPSVCAALALVMPSTNFQISLR